MVVHGVLLRQQDDPEGVLSTTVRRTDDVGTGRNRKKSEGEKKTKASEEKECCRVGRMHCRSTVASKCRSKTVLKKKTYVAVIGVPGHFRWPVSAMLPRLGADWLFVRRVECRSIFLPLSRMSSSEIPFWCGVRSIGRRLRRVWMEKLFGDMSFHFPSQARPCKTAACIRQEAQSERYLGTVRERGRMN